MKSKTLAAWLAFLGGPFGLHRFYLHGFGDWLGWLMPVPTLLGAYGVLRMWNLGQDDVASWLLVPVLGFTFAGCCLTAIVYGLRKPEEWNARFNPGADPEAPAGATRWATIWAIVLSLMIGAAVLMTSIAMSFQAYFQDQVEAGREISR
ncbi:TM2 domain-containing protein [Ramlibacter sp. USB13]|uniref:TM2 domain-containing protein n=1 Tax=Ramlibacter cellulosilyticus TaxID=2764187 RepID=A0A923MSM8_9BURK|nr:TM2 domain-containing protein [Ramlibacter cellulosilyticus]MBC5784251.1 TM2 domain-containing protein [Ramlibacter cellulosilyticus]